MVSNLLPTEKSEISSKNEQACTTTHANVVAADIIRTAEIRMQQRGMLPGGQNLSHNPFWFLVETEKNVYLWRSGCSLTEKDNFDFWVDIESLISKRLEQLERNNSNNPFSSGLDEFGDSENPSNAESEYLLALRDAIGPILNHLSALSEVQREILLENHATNDSTKRVVLPFSRA